jgi:hypothetical protein
MRGKNEPQHTANSENQSGGNDELLQHIHNFSLSN